MLNDPALRLSRAANLRAMLLRSPRKEEIVRLLCQGRTEAAIGRQLMIATCTVHAHVADIYDDLSVSDRLMLGIIIADAFPADAPSLAFKPSESVPSREGPS